MVVVGEKGKSHDADSVAVTGAGQGADDDAVELRSGGEEQAALDGAGRDLHQGAAVRDEAKESCHGAAPESKGLANPSLDSQVLDVQGVVPVQPCAPRSVFVRRFSGVRSNGRPKARGAWVCRPVRRLGQERNLLRPEPFPFQEGAPGRLRRFGWHFLPRYTHRVAISNQRLVRLEGEEVTFTWKGYARGQRLQEMT